MTTLDLFVTIVGLFFLEHIITMVSEIIFASSKDAKIAKSMVLTLVYFVFIGFFLATRK